MFPWPLDDTGTSGGSYSSAGLRRRSSSPRTAPKSAWRQIAWAKARRLPLRAGRAPRAGWGRAEKRGNGQVARCSVSAATTPRVIGGARGEGPPPAEGAAEKKPVLVWGGEAPPR